jgi:hypothetical protein
MDMKLSERIKADNFRIVPGRTYTTGLDSLGARIWRVTLASDINANTIEVEMTNSIAEGDWAPDPADVVALLVSDATGVDASANFVAWGSESSGFPEDSGGLKARNSNQAWDQVAEAWDVYEAVVATTQKLKVFLGPKYEAYLYETEFDI